eukprot:254736_1
MSLQPDIDDRTKYIVFGYIRSIESLLLQNTHNSPYFHIPLGICSLCLLYVDDHFMLHMGSYKWTISDAKLFSQMLSSNNKEQFVSPSFQIGGLKWIIQAYPNGIDEDSMGLFDIFVKLLSLPPKWDHIIVRRTIECLESSSKYTCIATYEKDSSFGWCDGALSLKEVAQFKQLTFVIKITILRIELIENHQIFYEINTHLEYKQRYKIEWKIDKQLMHKMKASNTGKCYESEIDKDGVWCIQCFPNGDNAASKGDVELYIQLCALPCDISKVEMRYTLSCVETLSRDTRVKEFDYDNDQSAKWSHDVLSFESFKQYETLAFIAEINILNKYDLKGDMLSDTQSHWKWYLEQNKYFQEISGKPKPHEDICNELRSIKCQISKLLSAFNELKPQYMIQHNDHCKEQEHDEDDTYEIKDKMDDELFLWLKNTVKLEQYYYLFVKNGFEDLESMKYVQLNELTVIGVYKLGHRLKLLDHINQLIQKQ